MLTPPKTPGGPEQYLSRPGAKAGLGWTFDKKEAKALADSLGGRVVDAEKYLKELNAGTEETGR